MIQNGSHEAYTQLIEQNTAWIRSMAVQYEKQYSNSILSCDDYEQEGRIALLHAAKRYMPEKGKFLTYAAVVIRTAMLDALRQTHPEINVVSLEENQTAVEAMQSDTPAFSRDIYRKSPKQLYLDKERMLALYDAMNRSSLRDTAWVRHRFGFDGKPCALAAAARDYGLSISRARRIEDEALRHIRENLAAQGREKAAA